MMLASCQKEQSFDQAVSEDDQINLLVDQSWNRMASEELFPENPSLGIDMLNEGIAADFLLDETYFEAAPPTNTTNHTIWYSIRDHSFIQCLRGLQLSEEQTEGIRQSLGGYGSCKEDAIKRARQIYRELRSEYQQEFLRLVDAYRNGTLTKSEFRQKVAELRSDFRKELQRLHLHERLDEALKNCLHDCMRDLHGILTDRQWNAFVDCYRSM
jgi:hypothetical protein